MALLSTLNDIVDRGPVKKNRMDVLLARLKSDLPGDYATLDAALRDTSIKHAVLTQALRREYGKDAVTDKSVGEWRAKNLAELTGL